MSSIVFLMKRKGNHYASVSFDTIQEYKRWIAEYHEIAVAKEPNYDIASHTNNKCDLRLDKINKTLKELRDGRSE